ncbi:7TM diverse intracellular signaling domain-containing protein [Chitinophaga defluvii]|uniref:histidine kinase n=1 Tax=Chitinophaga defluvii TaxID=3163343 RepID=A0ABV2TAH4_9BACT
MKHSPPYLLYTGLFMLMLTGILSAAKTVAQSYQPVLTIHEQNDDHLSAYYTYWLQPSRTVPDIVSANNAYQAGAFRHWHLNKTLSLGYATKFVWLRVEVKGATVYPVRLLWSIYNFADTVVLYREINGKPEKVSEGSSWHIAGKRLFPARAMSMPFWLQPGEHAVLYLCIGNLTGNIYFPTDITTTEDFLQWEQTFLFQQNWAWLIGFYAFSMLFSLILFAFLRDRIYLWYCLYVLLNAVFLLMEDGIDAMVFPQWLYSACWITGQYNMMLLSCSTGIKIMQLFISQRRFNPQLNRLGNYLIIFNTLFVIVQVSLIAWFSKPDHYELIHGLQKTGDALIVVTLCFVLYSLVKGVIKGSLQCRYYSITFFFFLAGCALFLLNHTGITNFNLMKPNALAWGLFFELLTLSALLTGRFRYTLEKISSLQLQEFKAQAALSTQLILAQDEERKRLAADLHDGIGAKLTAIRLLLQRKSARTLLQENEELKTLGAELENGLKGVAEELRNISHELMPPDFAEKRLKESVEELATNINLSPGVVVRTYIEAPLDQLPLEVQLILFRILTELVNNIIRHSGATEAMIQALIDEKNIQLIAEDNGNGFNSGTLRPPGIGLKNTKSRVEYLSGTMYIDTNVAGTGTTIIINIPNKYGS